MSHPRPWPSWYTSPGQTAGVVTRNQLFDAVWPGSEVTDDVLTQCIVELRKAFSDPARHPRVIQTIPKIGFRLLLPVVEPGTSTSATTEKATWKRGTRSTFFIAGTVLLVFAIFWYLSASRETPRISDGPPSVAVLPFIDFSEKQDQELLADGITSDLINRLAQLEGLQVTGLASSFSLKDRNEDPRDIADELGVSHLLEGTVYRDESQLYITLDLIDAKTGYHTWSGRFDTQEEDPWGAFYEYVASAISIKLKVGYLGKMPGGTDSVEAFEQLYLSSRFNSGNTAENYLRAINHAQRAVEIDPDYATAWFHLAGMYANARAFTNLDPALGWVVLARQALARALALEPDLPGATLMKVVIQYVNWEWSGVEQTLNGGDGLAEGPDFGLVYHWITFLNKVGRIRESVALLERTQQRDPYAQTGNNMLATAYAIQGRTAEALAEAERAFAREGRESGPLSGLLIAMSTNDRDLLLKWMARMAEHQPESAELLRAMTETLDDRETALAWLHNAFQNKDNHSYPDLIPFWAAWFGDTELALDAMQRQPLPHYFWINVNRDVRRLPRFKDLVRQVNLEEYFREYGWNDFCQPLDQEDFECE